jgi:hypothetical protein
MAGTGKDSSGTVKVYGEVEVILHTFLSLALVESDWTVAYSAVLTPPQEVLFSFPGRKISSSSTPCCSNIKFQNRRFLFYTLICHVECLMLIRYGIVLLA